MEADVQQSSVDKQCLEIANKELLLENDRLSIQIVSQDIVSTIMDFMSFNVDCMHVGIQRSKSCEMCLNLDVEFSKSKQAYDDLLKNYSQLKKHCISLEMLIQLNQEIFQKNESCINQNAPEIPKYFEKNDLKAQLQDKDTTICKLKDTIKSLRKNNREEIVDHDRCDPATTNEELENSVAKLLSKNERLCKEINHVKQVLKISLTQSNRYVNAPVKDFVNDVKSGCLCAICDSGSSKQLTRNHSQLMNVVSKCLGTVRFGNEQIARIMRYGEFQLGNVIISRVYYVEGLGHNLFSVGQFCDADLEVTFRKNTCFTRNLEGVDLLSGSQDTNLYTISLNDMLLLRTKDEAPTAIIKCIKNIQIH
nr:integrase, catalytic region, zinc finger, CCHC-type, peptidase aspartic, catalytic [Tanacetum cinerariifolium]